MNVLFLKLLISLGILIFGCSEKAITFDELLHQLDQMDPNARPTVIKEYVLRHHSFPIIEDSTALFLYESADANQVYLSGDICMWRPDSLPMIRISGSDFYYYRLKIPLDARIEYKFVVGNAYYFDPLNPLKDGGGLGQNSVLVMPMYIFPKEILINKAHEISVIDTILFQSKYLGNSRKVFFYRPDLNQKIEYLVIFNDGEEYLNYANARHILDNLISEKKIPLVYAAFVNPVQRNSEYWMNDDYLKMLFRELVPELKRWYNLKADLKIGLGGASLGGLISIYALKDYGEALTFIFSQSGALQVDDQIILKTIERLNLIDPRLYLDYGLFEGLAEAHLSLKNLLDQTRAEYSLTMVHEGHNWGNWRAHLGAALQYGLQGKRKEQ